MKDRIIKLWIGLAFIILLGGLIAILGAKFIFPSTDVFYLTLGIYGVMSLVVGTTTGQKIKGHLPDKILYGGVTTLFGWILGFLIFWLVIV